MTTTDPESKWCGKCERVLLLSCFGKWRYGKNNYCNHCRECRVADARERRARLGVKVRPPRAEAKPGHRQCSKCRAVLPINRFPTLAAGAISSWCKGCRAERQRQANRAAGKAAKYRRDPSLLASGQKECLECRQVLSLGSFSPCIRGVGGVATYCRECARRKYHNRARAAKNQRAYRRNNEKWREMHRSNMGRRRQQILASDTGLVTSKVIKSVYAVPVCFYCDAYTPSELRTMDHRMPVSRGGIHHPDNLVMACLSCNSSKQDKTEDEYREFLLQDRSRQRQPVREQANHDGGSFSENRIG